MLAIIGIIGLIALGMFRAHHKESHWAIVDFDELGSLQTEDVVVVYIKPNTERRSSSPPLPAIFRLAFFIPRQGGI